MNATTPAAIVPTLIYEGLTLENRRRRIGDAYVDGKFELPELGKRQAEIDSELGA